MNYTYHSPDQLGIIIRNDPPLSVNCSHPTADVPHRGRLVVFTFAGFAGDDSQEAQQADLVHGQTGVGPSSVQASPGTALLPGHSPHQHHVTLLVLVLLQPAHPSWEPITSHHRVTHQNHQRASVKTYDWFERESLSAH